MELSKRSEPRTVVTPLTLLCENPFCLAPENEAVVGDHALDGAGSVEVREKDVDVDVLWVRDPSAPKTVFSWLEICCSESANCCTFTGTEREMQRNSESGRCFKSFPGNSNSIKIEI